MGQAACDSVVGDAFLARVFTGRRNRSGRSSFTRAGMPRLRQLQTRWRPPFENFSNSASFAGPPRASMMALSACMGPNVHGPLTSCQLSVAAPVHNLFMATDPVWARIDEELRRRKAKHMVPGSWAAIGTRIDASRQTLWNWKTRGIPPKEYAALAGALDWTVDQLLGHEAEEVNRAPVDAPPVPGDLSARLAQLMSDIATTPPHLRLRALINAEAAVWDVRTGTAEAAAALQQHRSKNESTPIQQRRGDEGRRSK